MQAILTMEYGCGKSNVIVWNIDIDENLIGARKKNYIKDLIFILLSLMMVRSMSMQ